MCPRRRDAPTQARKCPLTTGTLGDGGLGTLTVYIVFMQQFAAVFMFNNKHVLFMSMIKKIKLENPLL